MTPTPVPIVVLDTNVVLDWLYFADPRAAAIAAEIESRQALWVATRTMRDELADVLGREPLRSRRPDAERVLLPRFDSLVQLWPQDAAGVAAAAPRCRDPDDQKFIDLAVAARAQWLLTRDRALLDLRGPAEEFGIRILAPRAWAAAAAGDAAPRG